MVFDVGFNGVVERAGHFAGFEDKSDRDDEIATGFGGVENTVAIGKIEVVVSEGLEGAGSGVVDFDGF